MILVQSTNRYFYQSNYYKVKGGTDEWLLGLKENHKTIFIDMYSYMYIKNTIFQNERFNLYNKEDKWLLTVPVLLM